MDVASSSTPSAQGRQKRVLPSRSRRGGPGVGHCEMDNLILDTQKRKFETEPLIPDNTTFFLTTNPAFTADADPPSDSESGVRINIVPNDRYFDRPEVLKAFREQASIQTPEFESIEESSTVGGRFRPRGMEDETAETSDAAYEKRHRKFETFEKRQRLREKEKLKHEHYKLKERIEQLRGMDGSAFMSLPAAYFTPPPQASASDAEDLTESSPYALNGSIPNAEGERRRKEMLDIAGKLEKRYQYLLPPDRVRKPQEPIATRKDAESRDGEESDTDRISSAEAARKDTANLKLRIAMRSSASSTPAPSPAATKLTAPKKPRGTAATPKQIARAAQNNISTPPTPFPVSEQSPLISSPFVDVEMETPEPTRKTTPPISPPTASDSRQTEATIPPAGPAYPEILTHTTGSQAPLPLQNGTSLNEELSIVSDGGQVADKPASKLPNDKQLPLKRGPSVEMADDGESEKADSEDEREDKAPEVHEMEPEPEESAANISIPTENGQGGDSMDIDVDTQEGQALDVSSEVRELSTRMEQTTVTEPPAEETTLTQEHEDVDEGLPAAAPLPAEQLESISTRPFKRRRRNAKVQELSALRSPSAQAEETASGRVRRKGQQPRGSHLFINSFGQKETTTSKMLLAAIRSVPTRTGRGTNAFGVATPIFVEMDYELPEELLYGVYERHEREAAVAATGETAGDGTVDRLRPADQEAAHVPEDVNAQASGKETIQAPEPEPAPSSGEERKSDRQLDVGHAQEKTAPTPPLEEVPTSSIRDVPPSPGREVVSPPRQVVPNEVEPTQGSEAAQEVAQESPERPALSTRGRGGRDRGRGRRGGRPRGRGRGRGRTTHSLPRGRSSSPEDINGPTPQEDLANAINAAIQQNRGDSEPDTPPKPVARRRGRPRKHPVQAPPQEPAGELMDVEPPQETTEPALEQVHLEKDAPVPQAEPVQEVAIREPSPPPPPIEATKSPVPAAQNMEEHQTDLEDEVSMEMESPEPDPDLNITAPIEEMETGVRPRELSRHTDDMEEQLEW